MKKLIYTLSALAAVFIVAGCERELRDSSAQGESTELTFTVAAPDMVTKAIGDGTGATELTFAVYDEAGNYLQDLSESAATISGANPTWTVSVPVVKDLTYQFAFVAKAAAGPYAVNRAAKTVTATYVNANDDAADLFVAAKTITITDALNEKIKLVRPLAQVNVGASDLVAAAYSLDVENMTTGLKLTGINNVLNILEGTVSGSADITLTEATRVKEEAAFVTGYDRIAMGYVLVGEKQTSNATINITANGKIDGVDKVITREVANIPLQANYRTNILGNIFTSSMNFTVTVEPEFAPSNSDKLLAPSFNSVSALNAYFATFKDNGDNGDVEPEEVTLADGATIDATTITLPEYAGTIRIKILPTAENLTLAYAAGSDKPATVEFYASNLTGTLAGELTDSHVTILEGSHIGTVSLQTSDGTLEVRPNAVIVAVNIVKGNANIAGSVTTVTVPAGATAVAGTPVQVFVAKEAAIKTITLEAKADVIVEQPKNNITSDTENKVEVVINAAGSTATAQNGGEIYLKANANCVVTATNDTEHTGSTTTVKVAEVATDVTVAPVEENGGDVIAAEGANVMENAVVSINNTTFCSTLTEAFAAAKDGDEIVLFKNYDATGETMYDSSRNLGIDKSITVNGNDNSLTVKGRGIAIGANATSKIDVTFKDIDILNSTNGARCIDTRGHIGTLTLDGVTLSTNGAPSGYTQPLTIGGNQSDAAIINISNSTIETNEKATAYYAIITFNPVLMSISNSTIKGWACIYAKGKDGSEGSHGSVFTIDNCELLSTNVYNGKSNAFAMFTVEDNDVKFEVTNSDLTVEGSSDQPQAIITTVTTVNENVVANLGSGNIVTLTGNGVFAMNKGKLSITGGTFNDDPRPYADFPYQVCANEDNTSYVVLNYSTDTPPAGYSWIMDEEEGEW